MFAQRHAKEPVGGHVGLGFKNFTQILTVNLQPVPESHGNPEQTGGVASRLPRNEMRTDHFLFLSVRQQGHESQRE